LLLPTPTAQDYGYNQGGGAGRVGKKRYSLQTMAKHGRWPTPRANDAQKRGNIDPNNPRSGLPAAAKRWPTPVAADAHTDKLASSQRVAGSKHSVSLPHAVKKWPTPTVGDSKNARNSTANRKTIPPTGIHKGDTLVDAVTKWPTPTARDCYSRGPSEANRHSPGLDHQVRRWPTPAARDHRSGKRKTSHATWSQLNDEVGGLLNPDWEEWLMGWPIGWSALKPLETDRSLSAQQLPFYYWLETMMAALGHDMSSTFDTMQHAVRWLAEHSGQDPERAYQVQHYLCAAINRLHDLHHDGITELNRVAGPEIACLSIVLRHDDPDKRQMYLDAREAP